jgi:hypothetical protein
VALRDATTEVPAWFITEALVRQAEEESARLFDVVRGGTYPVEWPVVAWLVKLIAGGRCEHCGRSRRLSVHHLDRDKWNVQHWNLVALCWETCHLWVETHLSLERDQLDLFAEGEPPWLSWRRRDRERWPLRQRAGLAQVAEPPRAGIGAGAGQACACGCGRRVSNASDGRRRLYFNHACRQRAYKARRLQQLPLFGGAPSRR